MTTLPGGALVGADEKIERSDSLALSLLLFFLKIDVALTNKRVVGQWPNTFLGLIPVGSNNVTYPVTSIASVAVSTKIRVVSLIVGIVLALAGLNGSLIILIIGVLLIGNAFYAAFEITNTAGQKIGHQMAFWEKGKAQALANDINTVLVNTKR